MISPESLFEVFAKNNLTFFTGVPDSTFKAWMSFLDDEHGKRLTNIITVNECEATAVAAGHYLGSGTPAVVYLQNSGFGKPVNPITSLLDKEVYGIPALLMIGWRGEPGKKDEPQHKKMGRIMLDMLKVLEIPAVVLTDNPAEIDAEIQKAKEWMQQHSAPYALIVRSGIVDETYEKKVKHVQNFEMVREDAIKAIVDTLDPSDIVVSTTGKTSRELFEYRVARNETPCDFYTVGSMGCASAIGFGIALKNPHKKIFVLDGDGAALMQFGSFATIGHYAAPNFYHVLIDNQSHDSTGGQPTVSTTVNFENVARATGYKDVVSISSRDGLVETLKHFRNKQGPALLIVNCRTGSRKDLGRPTSTPVENKESFMKRVKG